MIGALIALVSLDVTRKLVAAGMVCATLTITDATNATPIVITTAAPHGILRPTHAVVSGVGGNAGANGIWVMTRVSPTKLALTTYTPGGVPQNSVGSGSYTSGGTAKIAFPDGSILLGRRNVAMNMAWAAPRIVFVPKDSPAWDFESYGGVIPPATLPRRLSDETTEQKVMKLQRQLATEFHRFEVHVTGVGTPPDPDFGDFDATQALYHALYGSLFDLISPSRAKVLGGRWVSQDESMQSQDTHGQKWMGIVEIHQPVVDNPLAFVPDGTVGRITVNFEGGSSSDETVIIIPQEP